MKLPIAIIAFLVIAFMDFLIIVAAFLGEPRNGNIIIIVMVLGILIAVLFRKPLLVFTAQNIVTFLVAVNPMRYWNRYDAADIKLAVGVMIIGNILAWLIARAIPPAGAA